MLIFSFSLKEQEMITADHSKLYQLQTPCMKITLGMRPKRGPLPNHGKKPTEHEINTKQCIEIMRYKQSLAKPKAKHQDELRLH
jgi:hypothetical protein